MKLKAIALSAFLTALAASAVADTRVDLVALLGKDFIGRPSIDQAAAGLSGENPFAGFGWEVVMDHVGLGGNYLVRFAQGDDQSWWLDWNASPLFARFHVLGASGFVDPFVGAAIASTGEVFLGQGAQATRRLAISVFPQLQAGASVRLDHLRLGCQLAYALGGSAIPATRIPAYELGRFQVQAFVGFSFGGRPRHSED
jgi:hypothetical protein